MPSTAILLSAMGSEKVHAHRPDEDETLCGLAVIDPEDYFEDDYPPRSADWTGRRFYTGLHRLMCGSCCTRARQVRAKVVGEATVSFSLMEVREHATG